MYAQGDKVQIKEGYKDTFTDGFANSVLIVQAQGPLGVFVSVEGENSRSTVLIGNHKLEKIPAPKPFKIGDLVRIKKEHEQGRSTLAGKNLTVDGLNFSTASVKSGHMTFTIPYEILELSNLRVEGQTILPENVKVGDEISVRSVSDIMTVIKQGVVVDNRVHYDWNQNNRVIRVGPSAARSERIFTSKESFGKDITLIKAVQVDAVLEKLQSLAVGKTINAGMGRFAQKVNTAYWHLIYPTEIQRVAQNDLRSTIGLGSVDDIKVLEVSE